MTTTTPVLPLSDEQLKHAIEEELEWLLNLNSTHIGVAVDSGTVTLSGHIDSYPEKLSAARAAFRVRGVKSMAQEITVRSLFAAETDDDIAREGAVAGALRRHPGHGAGQCDRPRDHIERRGRMDVPERVGWPGDAPYQRSHQRSQRDEDQQ